MKVLCALLIAAALSGSARAEEGADLGLAQKHFQLGEYLYSKARYQEALKEFEAAKASFHLPALDFNIGQCLLKLGRRQEAVTSLETYLAESPNDPDREQIWRTIAVERKQLLDESRARESRQESTVRDLQLKLQVSPTDSIAASAPPSSKPVYKKAWFWVTVVGAVVVGAAVGLGVGFGTANHGSPSPTVPTGVDATPHL